MPSRKGLMQMVPHQKVLHEQIQCRVVSIVREELPLTKAMQDTHDTRHGLPYKASVPDF